LPTYFLQKIFSIKKRQLPRAWILLQPAGFVQQFKALLLRLPLGQPEWRLGFVWAAA
jgi:hypothetical protein